MKTSKFIMLLSIFVVLIMLSGIAFAAGHVTIGEQGKSDGGHGNSTGQAGMEFPGPEKVVTPSPFIGGKNNNGGNDNGDKSVDQGKSGNSPGHSGELPEQSQGKAYDRVDFPFPGKGDVDPPPFTKDDDSLGGLPVVHVGPTVGPPTDHVYGDPGNGSDSSGGSSDTSGRSTYSSGNVTGNGNIEIPAAAPSTQPEASLTLQPEAPQTLPQTGGSLAAVAAGLLLTLSGAIFAKLKEKQQDEK